MNRERRAIPFLLTLLNLSPVFPGLQQPWAEVSQRFQRYHLHLSMSACLNRINEP